MIRRTFLALTAATAFAMPAFAQDKDIVDTAVAAGSFNTLAAALTAAGLVETLKGEGPFTVFAPTDAAFAALPAGTVEDLLKPENKDKLTAVLTYHVVPGKVMSTDLTEGMTLSVFVLAVLVLSFYQEGQSEAAIEALRQLTQPQARVLRDGQTQLIPASNVVVGDWLLLSEGDRVAADGRLLTANNLQIDESLLTGESMAVDKVLPELPATGRPADQTPPPASCVHGGTFVVRGSGRAQVTATGMHSQIGQIGQALAQVQQADTPFDLADIGFLRRDAARRVRRELAAAAQGDAAHRGHHRHLCIAHAQHGVL